MGTAPPSRFETIAIVSVLTLTMSVGFGIGLMTGGYMVAGGAILTGTVLIPPLFYLFVNR